MALKATHLRLNHEFISPTPTSSQNSRFIYPITSLTVSAWVSNRCFKLNMWKQTSWFSDPNPAPLPVIINGTAIHQVAQTRNHWFLSLSYALLSINLHVLWFYCQRLSKFLSASPSHLSPATVSYLETHLSLPFLSSSNQFSTHNL